MKSSIAKHFGEVAVTGDAGGTHMLWELPGHYPPAMEFQQLARGVGIGIHPLHSGTVLHGDSLPGFERRVLLGYVHLTPAQINEGFARMANALAKNR